MAIINMGSSNEYRDGQYVPRETFHDGEYCPMPTAGGMNQNRTGDTLYLSHIGLCLSEYERNGYDDSDFFMRVWDPVEQCVKSIMFASTRGWSYPCYDSSPDATPEVLALADAWQRKQTRHLRACGLVSLRRKQRQEADAMGLAWRRDVVRLERAVPAADLDRVKKLLKTKKFRSDFRAKLAAKVREWLADPEPAYARPLSMKQLAYV